MKRHDFFLLLGLALLAASALAFSPAADRFFSMRACLDSGGSYEFATDRCDHAKEHPTPSRPPPLGGSPVLGFSLAGAGFISLLFGLRLKRAHAFRSRVATQAHSSRRRGETS